MNLLELQKDVRVACDLHTKLAEVSVLIEKSSVKTLKLVHGELFLPPQLPLHVEFRALLDAAIEKRMKA